MTSTFSTIVLDKPQLWLRLSSSPAPSDPGISNAAVRIPLEVSKKSRYPCTYPECTKSYSKPSRLAEHQRAHTGERPFSCSSCGKSYLRESHLQAHSRTHLSESEKPYTCTESVECNKRFWTLQHLVVHKNSHKGNKTYVCPKEGCNKAYAKHHQLRTHICEVHSPAGTKSYICSNSGCTKSFATNQKLRSHLKTHDDKRYACSHPHCLPGPDKGIVYFGTWTALQAHIRNEHPPTCMFPGCNGRTFASQHNLRAHQRLHEQREVEAHLHSDETGAGESISDAEGCRPRKRRRGGELGRDWPCDFAGCGKDFKSKNALTTHHNVVHLGQRNHVCPHEHCDSAFGYKHLLERHLAKLHSVTSGRSETSAEEETSASDTDNALDIEEIAGKTYAARLQNARSVCCPYPHIDALVGSGADSNTCEESSGKVCEHVLTRAYDLRRHLRSEHGVDTEKDKVDAWVQTQRQTRKLLGLPSSGPGEFRPATRS